MTTTPPSKSYLYLGIFTVVVFTAVGVVLLTRRQQRTGRSASQEKRGLVPFLTKRRQTVRLRERKDLSHDVRLYRFALPPNTVLGLPIGKHVKLFCPNRVGVKEGEWNGRPDAEAEKAEVERKYTPTSSDNDSGFFDLVIKHYAGGRVARFPDGGKMSQFLEAMRVGDSIAVQGPVGLHTYLGRGVLKSGRKEHRCSKIGMIAGGTGITPMLQLIRTVLSDPDDSTALSLLFANQTESDIFLREELEELERSNPGRFNLWYTVDRPPANWKYSSGFVNAEMIEAHLPEPDDEALILMCGPPPMIKFACKPNLEKLGFSKESMIEF